MHIRVANVVRGGDIRQRGTVDANSHTNKQWIGNRQLSGTLEARCGLSGRVGWVVRLAVGGLRDLGHIPPGREGFGNDLGLNLTVSSRHFRASTVKLTFQ